MGEASGRPNYPHRKLNENREDIDGIKIAPADSIRLVPVAEKATRAGIPVIAMNTPLNTQQKLTFVGFDNFAGGKLIRAG